MMNLFGITVIACAFVIQDATSEYCGGSYCSSDETCEIDVDGGTCFKDHNKVSCNSLYYCYRPTTCCGFSSCCPEGSTCCGMVSCCGGDSTCDGGICRAKSTSLTFGWYYIFFIIVPIVAICAGVCRWVRYSNARRPTQRTVITRTQFSSGATSPYSTAPGQPPISTISPATFTPPPRYEDLEHTAKPGEGANVDTGPKSAELPSYNDALSLQTTTYGRFNESSPEPSDPRSGDHGEPRQSLGAGAPGSDNQGDTSRPSYAAGPINSHNEPNLSSEISGRVNPAYV